MKNKTHSLIVIVIVVLAIGALATAGYKKSSTPIVQDKVASSTTQVPVVTKEVSAPISEPVLSEPKATPKTATTFSGRVINVLTVSPEGNTYEVRVTSKTRIPPMESAFGIVKVQAGPDLTLTKGSGIEYDFEGFYNPDTQIYEISSARGYVAD